MFENSEYLNVRTLRILKIRDDLNLQKTQIFKYFQILNIRKFRILRRLQK